MKALILFAHGARSPLWAEPFQRLQQITQQQLPDVAVHLAFLELMPPALPELVAQLITQGCSTITVVPVFLGQGGHIQRDLPRLIQALSLQYPAVRFHMAAPVGENPDVLQAIARYCIQAVLIE